MKTVEELASMTTRDIASDARLIMATHTPSEAKILLENHIKVVNLKIDQFSKKINKEFGTRRMPPQVKVISDFNRFK